jgi:hypothetical protein
VFLDKEGTVAVLVKKAMDSRIPVVMLHEQDVDLGGCPFNILFEQTPKELQKSPYKLFDIVAVPLFPTPEHRKMSLRMTLRNMGAKRPPRSTLKKARSQRVVVDESSNHDNLEQRRATIAAQIRGISRLLMMVRARLSCSNLNALQPKP